MKNKIWISLIMVAAFFAGRTHASGWSQFVDVTSIYLLDGNRAIVKLSNFDNSDNCQVDSSGDVFFNPSSESGKIWYSALLSAYASKSKVSIYHDGTCVPIWAGTSYSNIVHVRLQ